VRLVGVFEDQEGPMLLYARMGIGPEDCRLERSDERAAGTSSGGLRDGTCSILSSRGIRPRDESGERDIGAKGAAVPGSCKWATLAARGMCHEGRRTRLALLNDVPSVKDRTEETSSDSATSERSSSV
jgi:hypothetical protein